MKAFLRKLVASLVIMVGTIVPMVPVTAGLTPAMALSSTETFADVETNLLGTVPTDSDGEGIKKLLVLILKVLLYGIGAAAIIGVVIAGIIYLTARDNEAQVTKAKTRLVEIVIGLVAWALLFTVLQWLIPGFSGID